jgi:hypothetical protein
MEPVVYIQGGGVGTPRNYFSLTTLQEQMEQSPPLLINAIPNHNGTGAILHINFPSDGKEGRWMEDEEESDAQAKQQWLRKLGCLLKIHGNIECQCLWPHLPVNTTTTRPLHPDTFNNPWKYTISDFPEGYQLFSVERETRREGGPRRDHYLCGVYFYLPSICSLTDDFSLFRWKTQIPISPRVLPPPALVA